MECLQRCLETLRAARYGLLTTEFNISLAQGLAATGRFIEAMEVVNTTIQLVEAKGDIIYMPELHRVQAALRLSMPEASADEAEMWLVRSLDLSRRHGARSWELRTAVDLAALQAAQGRVDSARAHLELALEPFVGSIDTADLTNAKRLLATLG